MKTFSARVSDVDRKWYLIDASSATLGRLSTQIAKLLIGKGKTTFTKHIDVGDYVVVINCDKLKVTGNKLEDKMYYKHSGFPGGLTSMKLKDKMAIDSTFIILKSVRGMLPVNKLRDARLERLKLYPTDNHSHSAQKPTTMKVDN